MEWQEMNTMSYLFNGNYFQ